MIYFNNAATSYPKPPRVISRMAEILQQMPVDPRRGEATGRDALFECRLRLARLFGMRRPERVVLTPGATYSLNFALHGVVHGFSQHPIHCLSTVLEHNSVLRPLHRLQREGWIQLDLLSPEELLSSVSVKGRFLPQTRMVVLTAASNVTGQAPDLVGIGRLCRQRGVVLVIDAAQAGGCIPIDMSLLPERTLVALAGHKSLYGPAGTGALLVGEGFAEGELEPLVTGGTGLSSQLEEQPDEFPAALEAGTMNLVGFAGLCEGVAFVQQQGIDSLGKHRHHLITTLIDQLCEIPGIAFFGAPDADYRCGLLSLKVEDWDPRELSLILHDSYSLLTRGGLHCAPLAHRALGCPQGTVRVSVGFHTSEEDIARLCEAVRQVLQRHAVAV